MDRDITSLVYRFGGADIRASNVVRLIEIDNMIANSIASLESAVRSEPNPDVRMENLGRLGISLAQLGRIGEASEILDELRKYLALRYVLRILIRVMILEAIIPYYKDFRNSSDRLRRAHVLAVAADIKDLRAEVAVWMAHLSFNFDDFNTLGLSLHEALGHFEYLDHSHRTRLILVVADSLQYLGQQELASQWYGVARAISRHVHDHGLMVAIEFNRVAMGLSYIRISRALGLTFSEAAKRNWIAEVGSVRNLHYGFGAQALFEILDLCDAFAMEMDGKYLEAIEVLKKLKASGNLHRCGVSDALVDLEVIWCQVEAGVRLLSSEQIQQEYERTRGMSLNDQILAIGFLQDIAKKNKYEFATATFECIADDLASAIDQEWILLRRALSGISDRIDFLETNWNI